MDPEHLLKRLAADGEQEVRRKLLIDAYGERNRPIVERWLAERDRQRAEQDLAAHSSTTTPSEMTKPAKEPWTRAHKLTAIGLAVGALYFLANYFDVSRSPIPEPVIQAIDRCISNRISGRKKRREVGALDEGAEAFG